MDKAIFMGEVALCDTEMTRGRKKKKKENYELHLYRSSLLT